MAAIRIGLPSTLTAPAAPVDLACEATTVSDALEWLAGQRPELRQRIFYKRRLLVGVTVNGRSVAPSAALATELAPGDRLELVPPVAGG
jgi:molybdopterin converting factor small subunit